MGVESIIIWLIVGAIAGWLAGMVVRGGCFGLIGDIVVGIIGAVIAGWLLPYLGIALGTGFIAAVIDAFIGAVILLIILRLVQRVCSRAAQIYSAPHAIDHKIGGVCRNPLEEAGRLVFAQCGDKTVWRRR